MNRALMNFDNRNGEEGASISWSPEQDRHQALSLQARSAGEDRHQALSRQCFPHGVRTIHEGDRGIL